MAWQDYRDYIRALEASGDVVRIAEEVECDLEMGAISRRGCEKNAPAPLFENIKDYPGFRAYANPFASYRRFAVAFGLPPDASFEKICDVYDDLSKKRIKPIVVDERSAPCKENKLLGDDADLHRLPVPMVHDGDGGRYIGTWHIMACKDLDSDWINWGMYRVMMIDGKYCAAQFGDWSDQGRIFFRKYVPKGLPMPVAISLGSDPLCDFASMAVIPQGDSEAEAAGGWRGAPVELVKCERSDILVPARSEVVIEGEMLPDAMAMEGPFGEFSGYRTGTRRPQPLMRVTAITYRNNPIMVMSNLGVPTDDNSITKSVMFTLRIKDILREAWVPFTGVYVPPVGAGNFLAVVRVKTQGWPNLATHVGNLVSSLTFVPGVPHMVIVVDDDVDIYNMDEVIHALCTKCHPVRGIRVRDHEPGNPLNPFLNLHERINGLGSRVIFDCTWPLDWPKESVVPAKIAFNSCYSPEVQERALGIWERALTAAQAAQKVVGGVAR